MSNLAKKSFGNSSAIKKKLNLKFSNMQHFLFVLFLTRPCFIFRVLNVTQFNKKDIWMTGVVPIKSLEFEICIRTAAKVKYMAMVLN